MARFASNKRAFGYSERSGFRYKLKDMKRTWDGLLVGPDQFDPKHPQLMPRPVPQDPQALRNARPQEKDDNNFFVVYTNVGDGKLGKELTTFGITSGVGSVTVSIT